MPSELVTIDGDSSPVDWLPSGVGSHASHVQLGSDGKWINALGPDLEDRFSISDPVGPIGVGSKVTAHVLVKFSSEGPVVGFGFRMDVYTGAVLLGSKTQLIGSISTPTTFNVVVDGLSYSQAEADDFEFAFVSVGTGWLFAVALIQIDKIDATIEYALAVPKTLELESIVPTSVDLVAEVLQTIELEAPISLAIDLESETTTAIDVEAEVSKTLELESEVHDDT